MKKETETVVQVPPSGELSNVELERECLDSIRAWLNETPNLKARDDDLTLLYFLRGCKYNIIKTQDKIYRFYLIKTQRTEWFSNRDPFLPEIQQLLDIGVFLPLDRQDDEKRRVIVIRTSAHDPKLHMQNNVFKVGKMILDLLLRMDPEISLHGIVAIFDMKGVSLGHALQMTPTIIKRAVDTWQVYPCKPKLLKFVNSPPYINVILNTFRLFMSSKMRSRIVVTPTSGDNVNLPKELGGNGKSYAELAQYWKEIVEENADFFQEDETYRIT